MSLWSAFFAVTFVLALSVSLSSGQWAQLWFLRPLRRALWAQQRLEHPVPTQVRSGVVVCACLLGVGQPSLGLMLLLCASCASALTWLAGLRRPGVNTPRDLGLALLLLVGLIGAVRAESDRAEADLMPKRIFQSSGFPLDSGAGDLPAPLVESPLE